MERKQGGRERMQAPRRERFKKKKKGSRSEIKMHSFNN